MSLALELKNVTVQYQTDIAVKNVSLAVEEGEFLIIMGPNGGGKSTLIKAVLDLVPLTAGEITINGQNRQHSFGKIGYVPQQSYFDHKFPITVKDVILMGRLPAKMRWFHRYSAQDHEIAQRVMADLNIEHLAHKNLDELSGGQKQKVLIARALSTHPEILVLDEPTTSLDPPSRLQIYNILKTLNEKMTIVMISHDDQTISQYGSTMIYFNKRILYKGKDFPPQLLVSTNI
ncbi:zinc ABC transporter ATP-binding protein [Pullulanibacillus camelliae]|uniref:Zinc ABC transporter ATP-binding protein n=1 Tax=Pullulanibacillus camelliae TaxID=1707096 RepID=A0A8J2YDC9_9BACL|nr:metal ABC transporter ATP-binding protein [Pullulanibacillus camelliae]GGE39573.1 zinc ABC transporter ATP-binding protein [Pullulanibacillus camelliae]